MPVIIVANPMISKSNVWQIYGTDLHKISSLLQYLTNHVRRHIVTWMSYTIPIYNFSTYPRCCPSATWSIHTKVYERTERSNAKASYEGPRSELPWGLGGASPQGRRPYEGSNGANMFSDLPSLGVWNIRVPERSGGYGGFPPRKMGHTTVIQSRTEEHPPGSSII